MTAKQKELRSGADTNHEYSTEFLYSDRIVNIHFTSDVGAKDRIRS